MLSNQDLIMVAEAIIVLFATIGLSPSSIQAILAYYVYDNN